MKYEQPIYSDGHLYMLLGQLQLPAISQTALTRHGNIHECIAKAPQRRLRYTFLCVLGVPLQLPVPPRLQCTHIPEVLWQPMDRVYGFSVNFDAKVYMGTSRDPGTP